MTNARMQHAAARRPPAQPSRNWISALAGLALSAAPLSAQAHDAIAVQYWIGALIVVQTALIIALFIQNRRHQRAKASAEKQYAEITHAARLALVGELTASVAHEITQPLSAILSNVETAQFLLRAPTADPKMIGEILEDVRRDDLRAHSMVQRLRTLLRKRELQFEPVDINSLTSSVLALILPDAVRRRVIVHTAFEAGLPKVPGDPVHLQQVILNLLLNAMDSMKETPTTDRRLDIRTERHEESCVLIAIGDHGHGIEAHQVDRLFEPFYTTKGDGMGLGLSIARSIVHMHGGSIWAENRDGGGAAFKFTVPLP